MAKQSSVHHRKLHFDTLDEATAELDRILAADQQRTLQCHGKWTAGQNLSHLATWVGYAYTGVPLKMPWIIRTVLSFRRNAFLNKPMSIGLRIPGVPGGTLAMDDAPTQQAGQALRERMLQLKTQPPTMPHPFLGNLSHNDWIKLHLRHTELHFGFLNY